MLSAEQLQRSLSSESLHLILLPTEACNFRCVYCYEEFKYKRMEPWVVEGVKRWIASRADRLGSLTLSWFGGEPLLARDIILDLMGHAQELARIHPALHVESNATTNGYLLGLAVLEELTARGVTGYQVSFDGPKRWHDRKRVLAGGRGTFDRIWTNLLRARESTAKYTITVRIHADRENAAAIPELIEQFEEAFGADPRFEIFIRGLSRLGGPMDASLPVFEREEGVEAIEQLKTLARARGLKIMEPGEGHSICYAARANSFVVRANGRLNKCTVALEHPNNQVGVLREDGTVTLATEKMLPWMRGLRSGNLGELKCPMRGLAEPPAVASKVPTIPLAVAAT